MMRHQGTKTLETERLLLRRVTAADAREMYEHWASDGEVTRYLTWPTHTGVDMTEAFLRWTEQQYEKPEHYHWGIVEKASGKLIGNISVVRLIEEIDAAELGWALGRAWWGRGIMPEAARAVLQFLFDEVGVNRVYAGHDAENQNSGRVMQKIGMTYEGRQRAAGRNNRGVVDMDQYAILKGDPIK